VATFSMETTYLTQRALSVSTEPDKSERPTASLTVHCGYADHLQKFFAPAPEVVMRITPKQPRIKATEVLVCCGNIRFVERVETLVPLDGWTKCRRGCLTVSA
jgi:hypothetical protein